MTSVVVLSPSSKQQQQAQQQRMQVLANGDIVDCGRLPTTARNTLYKTELCKHFTETGTCRYGTKCQFAHGHDELRGVLRHPKYKTTKCKAFLTSGKCMYGSRCRFIHDNSSPEDASDDDDEFPMTRAEQDQENMKAAPRHHAAARVNPRRMFDTAIDLSAPGLKLKPVVQATPSLSTPLMRGGALSPSLDNQDADDIGFSRLSIFQKICRASD
ncbi:unnamed protein product [Aphanomyces euteiches]